MEQRLHPLSQSSSPLARLLVYLFACDVDGVVDVEPKVDVVGPAVAAPMVVLVGCCTAGKCVDLVFGGAVLLDFVGKGCSIGRRMRR